MSTGLLEGLLHESSYRSVIDPKLRFIATLEDLEPIIKSLRFAEKRIVLTQGTFDMFHIGHVRYLHKAREHGDVLIVGVDDDAKARERKGENRPVVPLEERVEIITSTGSADIVLVKQNTYPKWHLIKVIRPDILIAVEGTYTPEEIDALKEHCDDVVVLKRQAETSTSAKTRKLVLDGAETITRVLAKELPERMTEMVRTVLPGIINETYKNMRGDVQ
jgi:D-beta-D-heptose 7-phosphate kinase/D-beta-D-heptose 1-phosphate adenosyltransferase